MEHCKYGVQRISDGAWYDGLHANNTGRGGASISWCRVSTGTPRLSYQAAVHVQAIINDVLGVPCEMHRLTGSGLEII
jgi:hypothetical protein